MTGSSEWPGHSPRLVVRVISPVTYNWAVETFLGAKRMECVQLAGAFGAPLLNESASKLDALHTLRDMRLPNSMNVTVFTTAHP